MSSTPLARGASLIALALLSTHLSTRAGDVTPSDAATRLNAALTDAAAAASDLVTARDAATTRAAGLAGELAATRQAAPTSAPIARADLVVSLTGDDAAAGTADRPLRTITAAASRVQAGQTILIRPGVYREAIHLTKGGAKGKPITFRADAPNTVIIDGADVLADWSPHPDAAAGLTGQNAAAPVWSIAWPHSFDVGRLDDGSRKRYFGMLPPDGFCEQLFQDGRPLRRILGPMPTPAASGKNNASIGREPGTFWIDYGAKKLFACPWDNADPSTVEMTAPVRDRLFLPRITDGKYADASYVTLQNLTFRHACNFPQRGAVTVGTGWRLEDVTVERVAAVGLWLRGDDVTLLRVVAADNGQAGIGGTGVTNSLLKDCVVRGNNTRRFPGSWEGGGGKFSRANGLRIENHTAVDNMGPGLWFDLLNKNITITNSTFATNKPIDAAWQGAGVMVEISDGPVRIERSTFDRNAGAGVAIYESTGVTVTDNDFRGTGVELRDMQRKDGSLSTATITNNRFAERKSPAITTAAGSWTGTTAADKQLTIRGNTFAPSAAPVAVWGGKKLPTVEAFDAAANLGK